METRPGIGEVQRAEVGDGVAFERAGVVEVGLLQRLASREPRGADAALTAMALAGRHFTLQAGDEELLDPRDEVRIRSGRGQNRPGMV
jgi:hypothetical protein